MYELHVIFTWLAQQSLKTLLALAGLSLLFAAGFAVVARDADDQNLEWFSIALVIVMGLTALSGATYLVRQITREAASMAARQAVQFVSAGQGVVLLDWVDRRRLAAIARQKGISEKPVRMERGRRQARAGGVKAAPHGIGIEGRTETDEDERSYYEFAPDDETLLVEVLQALEAGGEVETGVADPPAVPFAQSPEMSRVSTQWDWMFRTMQERLSDPSIEFRRDLEAIRHATAEDSTELFAKLLSSVVAHGAAQDKKEQFRRIVDEGKFVLIETDWSVEHLDGALRLTLARFRSDGGRTEAVPPEIKVVTSVRSEGDVPERFQSPQIVPAGVFGIPRLLDDGSLEVSPIAVFLRMGRRR